MSNEYTGRGVIEITHEEGLRNIAELFDNKYGVTREGDSLVLDTGSVRYTFRLNVDWRSRD